MKRNRFIYLVLIICTILIGLFSRSEFIPKIIYSYAGDYFYALMIFWIVALLFNKKSTLKITIASILICFSIEFLQLYQAHWINAIRNNRFGALVLGSGFLWSDLICYIFGGLTGYVLETFYYRNKSTTFKKQ